MAEAETVSLMDIDEDENKNLKPKDNGKNVIVSGTPPDIKASPWVEKYRPQSLADVAAHRDIVDTSNFFFKLYYLFSRVYIP